MKNNTTAGALLFAIITAFVISMVVSALVLLTTNQYRIINSEIRRTQAFYRAQAAMEHSIYQSYTNPGTWLPASGSVTHPVTIDGKNVDININYNTSSSAISPYEMRISTNYEN